MITPEQFKELLPKINIDKIIKKIDIAIIESAKIWHYNYADALIDENLDKKTRDCITKKYLNNGWIYGYHITSQENGERPGLTHFKFSMFPLPEKNIKNFYMISNIDNK